LVWTIFIFLLSFVNFHHKTLTSDQKIKILIPHWTHFHCPGAPSPLLTEHCQKLLSSILHTSMPIMQ